MADKKNWDRSDSFIYTWRNSDGKKEYYAAQLIFCNKTLLKEWDIEEEPTGYYAMMVNCKYDKITGKPYDANMLFSDLKLLVACTRRSKKNYELAMEKFSEVVYSSIEIMEKDRETMRTMGATDDEIDNIIRKIREEYENEKMEKENKMPMLKAEPLEKKNKKEEEKNDNKVYLKDIAGLKEVKEEVMEIVDAFRNKEKYEKFGIKMNLNILLSGSPGCVDKDTEYFNGTKWVKINEYKEGDKVLIYDENGKARLELPQRYIKESCEEMTLITNASGSINQCLSDDHRVMYTTSKTMKPHFIRFDEFKKQYQQNVNGFNGFILSAFEYEGKGIELSDEEMRVQIMTMADATFTPNDTNYCTLRLKKERKIERAKELLDKANIEYGVHLDKKNNFTVIHYYAPRKEKVFGDFWYDCNKHQFEVILDECLKWDGNEYKNRKQFNTTVKENADFIQFVSSALGKRSVVHKQDRRGREKETNGKTYQIKSIEYTVQLTNQNKLGLIAKKDRPRLNFTNYKTEDGFKYCFTVETGMLILRRNGRIFVTGNCGKTMLGKAIANECGATFYYECGSNFMNKYVGVGASKVRELYDNARKNAPSVIFIDECECVMGKRSSDENSGKEAAQTLNQILVELDGMNTTDDVITICATNRPDILDEAVLRAGRLSRKIEVPVLDIEGRRELIKLYAEPKPLNEDVDLEEIARMSSGMSGAELFNLINEAAIYAVRGNQDDITMKNFKDAYEKITTGLKSQTKRLSDKEKRVTAVHELSHALCGLLLGSERKISKLSILPRNNNTLGFVLYQHDDIEDKYIYTKEELENRIKVSLAGKIGEKIVFNHYSSGCQGDLDNVSNIAYNMVTRYGMSNLGSFNMDKDNLFLQEKIHEEMNAIVGKCYKECKALLKDNLDILNSLVDYVIQEEEITGEEFERVYNDALEKRKQLEIND